MPRTYDDDEDRPRKRPRPRDDDDDDRPRARRRPRDDDEDNYDDRPRKKRRSKLRPPQANVLGIISLVVGILAVLFSFIPCVGLYAFIPGALGLILGGIGLVMYYTSDGRYERKMPIIGLSINAVAILFGLSWILVMNHWKKEFNNFDKDFQAEMAKAEAERKKEQASAAKDVKAAAAGTATRLTAEQFFKAFEDDPDRADRSYKNKVLELTGVVKAVHLEAGAYGVVLKGGADEGALVECEFAEDASVRAVLSRLTPGQRVTIRGKCLGGDAAIEACVLVE
jgi:putative nucleic acid binding protein